MTQPDTTQLHQFLVDHFSLEELKTLCFNLGVEFEDLGGEGRSDKARELVKAMQRRTRLEHLVAHLSIARPDAYRRRFHQTPTIPAAPARARRNPRQVFISHAHQDAAFAQRLAGDLRARGFPVWISPDSIGLGEDWPDAIDRGLDESGVIVVALTPDALTSYWVRKETSTARLLAGRGLVEFILLDVAECDPPSSWNTYQFAFFRSNYERGLNELLRRLAGEDPLPHPLPKGEGARPLPDRRIHAKTGIELIRIPAGPFLYGSADSDKMARANEKPQRTVNLPEYWIGRTPVTNRQYKRFLDANPGQFRTYGTSGVWPFNWETEPGTYPVDEADHPVVMLLLDGAQAFCKWAGLTLPTEEQWEKAARGMDGRMWPWGNELPTVEHCNFKRNVGGTTSVGRYSPRGDSPYGCVDMSGNISEWTTSSPSYSSKIYIRRGGSWVNSESDIRSSARDDSDTVFIHNLIYGFRVVAPIGSDY